MLDTIHEMLRDYPNVSFDTEMDATASMSRADVMISDKSCVRFDFAFLYEKPVITLDIPVRNPELYEVADLGVIWGRHRGRPSGRGGLAEDFNNIVPVVERALKTPSSAIAAFREKPWPAGAGAEKPSPSGPWTPLARMDAGHAAQAAPPKRNSTALARICFQGNAMSLLYEIFILPIEIIYRAIYLGSLQFTHNYGLSILVLSCISAVAFIPWDAWPWAPRPGKEAPDDHGPAAGPHPQGVQGPSASAASTTSASAMPTIRCWPSVRPSAWPCRSPS